MLCKTTEISPSTLPTTPTSQPLLELCTLPVLNTFQLSILVSQCAPGLSGQTPANPDDYKFYDDGVTDGVFLKGADGQPFVGKGWAGDVVYPDFTHAKAMDWWHKGISDFHTQIPFDGLWLDKNEATNMCNGACYPEQKAADPEVAHLNYLPTGRSLEDGSISLDAVHADGTTELDAHSSFAWW